MYEGKFAKSISPFDTDKIDPDEIVVIGCSEEKGITFAHTAPGKEGMISYCITPSVPHYKLKFDFVVKGIKTGTIDFVELGCIITGMGLDEYKQKVEFDMLVSSATGDTLGSGQEHLQERCPFK